MSLSEAPGSTARSGPNAAPRRRSAQNALVATGILAWACFVLIGIAKMAAFETTPGERGPSPPAWPAESSLSPVVGTDTLVMFVHPKCPCSRASLAELGSIMASAGDRTTAFVVFFRPDGVSDDWEETDSFRAAGRIPHTSRFVDRSGTEAARFGALTSGHVVLYDPDGRLRFTGGITESRGHTGDNVGRDTVLGLLARVPVEHHEHEVFGCSLNDPAGAPRGIESKL